MTGPGYLSTSNRHPVSLGLAVALTGAGLTALLLVEPIVKHLLPDNPLKAEEIAIEMAPAPKLIKPAPTPKAVLQKPATPTVDASRPKPEPQTGLGDNDFAFKGLDTGNHDIIRITPALPPEPVLVEASINPRFSKDLQPPYPPSLQRLEIEGVATVRVQIDTDGHVLRVESVTADNEGFLAATRGWAIRHWRFKPATRDGLAVMSWKTMTVRFRINR